VQPPRILKKPAVAAPDGTHCTPGHMQANAAVSDRGGHLKKRDKECLLFATHWHASARQVQGQGTFSPGAGKDGVCLLNAALPTHPLPLQLSAQYVTRGAVGIWVCVHLQYTAWRHTACVVGRVVASPFGKCAEGSVCGAPHSGPHHLHPANRCTSAAAGGEWHACMCAGMRSVCWSAVQQTLCAVRCVLCDEVPADISPKGGLTGTAAAAANQRGSPDGCVAGSGALTERQVCALSAVRCVLCEILAACHCCGSMWGQAVEVHCPVPLTSLALSAGRTGIAVRSAGRDAGRGRQTGVDLDGDSMRRICVV
jgi:hypothetical protein